MEDLKSLREELHKQAMSIPEDTTIPMPLKQQLKDKWTTCDSIKEGQFELHTDKGHTTVTDAEVIRSIYARPLTEALFEYKTEFSNFIRSNKISTAQLKSGLNGKTKRESPPSWWPVIDTEIKNSENLSDEEKEQLIRFALDNEWSGCTKGSARFDFNTSSVVNALGANTTHRSILAKVAKELISFDTETRQILDWYEDPDSTEFETINTLTTINNRLWLFAPGEGAYLWDEQYQNGEAAIGWDALGDLSQYQTRKEITDKLKALENLDRNPWNNSLACWQFPNEIKAGDWILVKRGKSHLLGYGVVTSDYIYDSERKQYHHIRKVDWKVKGEWDAKEFNLVTKTLTDLTPYPEYVARILSKMAVDVPGFITDRIGTESIDNIQIATTTAMPQQVLSSYKLGVKNSGFNFSDELLKTFLASLISKPFTILTGASGTGKTKIAELLSHHLSDEAESSYAIVPVGADWTDTRNVLGFVNHLRDDGMGEGQPIFQSTKVLDLLLNAEQNPDYPHFLILDEMNLSHVERYFSDFLSVMEQNNGELKLHSEGDLRLLRSQDDKVGVPQALAYPKNLFVIGTVNIDETTYMFSPKVLDRANVIEFTVSAEDIGAFLAEPKAYQEIEQAEAGIAEGLLDLARKAQESDWEILKEPASKDIAAHLLNLFKILKAGRFEFAYRTAKEVNTYLRVCRHLADDSDAWDGGSWQQDLDGQILQKLLPKLHGSMGRIGNLLAELAVYCHTGTYTEKKENSAGIQLKTAVALEASDTTPFPKSLAKLQSMIRTLQDEQFVSFIQ